MRNRVHLSCQQAGRKHKAVMDTTQMKYILVKEDRYRSYVTNLKPSSLVSFYGLPANMRYTERMQIKLTHRCCSKGIIKTKQSTQM